MPAEPPSGTIRVAKRLCVASQERQSEMIARLKQRIPAHGGRILDRLMVWSAALLVLAVASFAVYYYIDQKGGGDSAGPMERRISSFETIVRENPDDASARANLATLYFEEGRYSEAIQQYQVALDLDEENEAYLVGLGRALLSAGDHRAAAEKFQKAVDLSTEAELTSDVIETAYYYLGSIGLTEGKPDEAVAHLKKALDVEPTDADAWYLLGAASIEADDIDGAIEALTRAVLFVPDYTEAYEKLIVAYEEKGLEAEARYARGMLAYSEGRYGDAVTELEAAIAASPELASAYAGLGLARESLSERDAAIAAYQRAIELDPDSFSARSGLVRLGAPEPEEA